jgi:hypothetical protein
VGAVGSEPVRARRSGQAPESSDPARLRRRPVTRPAAEQTLVGSAHQPEAGPRRDGCDAVQVSLSAQLDGEVGPIPAAVVAAHLERCGPCRRFATEAPRLGRQVAIRVHRPLPDGVAAAVLAEAVTGQLGAAETGRRRLVGRRHREALVAPPVAGRGRSGWWRWAAPVAPVAAIVIFALGTPSSAPATVVGQRSEPVVVVGPGHHAWPLAPCTTAVGAPAWLGLRTGGR